MKKLKVVFMGTPEFSVLPLKKLIKNTNVVLVVTRPDAYVGRKKILTPCATKKVALENEIETFSPYDIKTDYQKIIDLNPDIIITCAYGQILPKELLEVPKYGCINIHASLLPKYRGGAPIHHAILNGEKETGITIMYMDEGMDTGDIIKKEKIEIKDKDNLQLLEEKLSLLGSDLILKTLPLLIDGNVKRIKQDHNIASYAPIIKRKHEKINFKTKTAIEVLNMVRAFYPKPLAYFEIDKTQYKVEQCKVSNLTGKVGTVIKADKDNFIIMAKDKAINILKLKPVGKNTMSVKDFFNGNDPSNFIDKEVN